MVNEKDFKETFGKLNHEQLLDLAFNLQKEVDILQENNSSLKRSLYGRKRENVSVDQLSLFNEAEVTDEISNEEEKAEPEIEPIKSSKKKRCKNRKIKEIKAKTIDIKMDTPICELCGAPLSEIKPKIIERLVYIPAELYIEKTIIHQYTCHKCNEAEETMYVFQNEEYKEPKPLIKGSMATSSFVSKIAYDKFVMCVPYYRQEKELNDNGIPMSRQNICNYVMKCGEKYLKPVFEKMEKDIRSSEIVNMDETTLLCLEERKDGRSSNSYEWMCITNAYEKKQMALYYYKKDRGHGNVAEILGDNYQGIIQSDGYQAYGNYISAKGHAGCLSHARRKFEDALKSNEALYKKITNKGLSTSEKEKILEDNPSFKHAFWFLNQYDKVLKIEKAAKNSHKSIQELESIRKEKEESILDALHQKAKELEDKVLPSGKLYKAIQYTLNQWNALIYYLQDGRIPATNNIAEREGIKPFVMARKNFLFADTRRGAEISSIWFSLIISARMNKLNIEKYLTYVLDELSAAEEITDEIIDKCLPYSTDIPSNIKL